MVSKGSSAVRGASSLGALPLAALLCVALAAAFLVNRAPAQTPAVPEKPTASEKPAAQETSPEASFKSTTNLVVIPVSVTDASNRFVLGLQKEDFQIFEDGVAANHRALFGRGCAAFDRPGL